MNVPSATCFTSPRCSCLALRKTRVLPVSLARKENRDPLLLICAGPLMGPYELPALGHVFCHERCLEWTPEVFFRNGRIHNLQQALWCAPPQRSRAPPAMACTRASGSSARTSGMVPSQRAGGARAAPASAPAAARRARPWAALCASPAPPSLLTCMRARLLHAPPRAAGQTVSSKPRARVLLLERRSRRAPGHTTLRALGPADARRAELRAAVRPRVARPRGSFRLHPRCLRVPPACSSNKASELLLCLSVPVHPRPTRVPADRPGPLPGVVPRPGAHARAPPRLRRAQARRARRRLQTPTSVPRPRQALPRLTARLRPPPAPPRRGLGRRDRPEAPGD